MSMATKNYIKKSIERLYGIIQGISIDCQVDDQEIITLKNWMDTHELMHNFEPFKGLNLLLSDILADGIIEEHERDDLLEWCADTLNEQGFLNTLTQVVRRLHGLFSGIVSDQTITTDELEGLNDWLLDYEPLHGWWPLNELLSMIKNILKDGKIDDKEHQTLMVFFADFEEQILGQAVIHDEEYWLNRHVMSPCPIFKPVASICEKDPKISFQGKLFCLTGPAASGSRKDLFKEIEKIGGLTQNRAVKNLDYLILGAQSSPAWVYSTYGRKIETVINRKDKNKDCPTLIVSEHDFIQAAKKAGAFQKLDI